MNDIKCTVKKDRIRLYKYETDKFKSENISIYFSVPFDRKRSVARSLLLSVLKRGTEKYPNQRDINMRLDELYATLVNLKNQKFDSMQLLGMSADVIYPCYTENGEDLIGDSLEVISQIFLHPALDGETGEFCREYINGEKENYKSIIMSQINEPRTYAAIRCREETFASLGITESLDGMCERIDNTSSKELLECYREMLESAEIIVFYVGNRDTDDVYSQVATIFGSDELKEKKEKKNEIPLLEDREEAQVVVEDSDISQSRLVMSFNCRTTWREDDYYAMLLCNEILGASPISKLMVNVREAMSLCYECSSVYNSARGVIFVTTGINREDYDEAKDAILDQINAICEGKISENEIFAAKKSISNVYSAVSDSPTAIERFYLGRLLNGVDVDIAEFIRRIEELTPEDIVRAAKKLKPHTVYLLRGNECGEEELDE